MLFFYALLRILVLRRSTTVDLFHKPPGDDMMPSVLDKSTCLSQVFEFTCDFRLTQHQGQNRGSEAKLL